MQGFGLAVTLCRLGDGLVSDVFSSGVEAAGARPVDVLTAPTAATTTATAAAAAAAAAASALTV